MSPSSGTWFGFTPAIKSDSIVSESNEEVVLSSAVCYDSCSLLPVSPSFNEDSLLIMNDF